MPEGAPPVLTPDVDVLVPTEPELPELEPPPLPDPAPPPPGFEPLTTEPELPVEDVELPPGATEPPRALSAVVASDALCT